MHLKMDRMPSQPALVADALRLLGAPACACDGAGIIIAANDALGLLLGASPLGRALPELFVDAAAQTAEGQLAQALHLGCNWHGVLGAARGRVEVQVRSQPLAHGGASLVFADVSAYEQGRETLRTTVLEQRVLIENAPVGILFTQGGRMRSCNPRLAAMAGYTPEELACVAPVDMFESPEAFVHFMNGAFGTIAQGQVYEKTGQRFRRRDGSLFWCRVRAHLVEPDRREAGTIWIVEDITEARRAQLEVEALLTNSALAIIFTRERAITRCNGGFREMFGYPAESALPTHVRGLYADDAACDAIGAAAFEQFALGRSYTTETAMVRADGTPLWVQLIGFMVNPEEPLHGNAWIVEDRTRHKRSEESLRDALLENQAILDSAVLGIAVVENGHILHCNRKMEELFGCVPGGIGAVSVRTLYPDADAWQAARAETARDFAAARVHVSEHRLIRRDGEVFWARLSGRPFDLENPGGRSVWMVDDVTAQREAAEEVRRARDELEVRVAERTAELAGANALLQDEILERRQAEARVHHMAYHDSLTGLPNRALLADRMEQAILAAGRSNTKLAVMFIDLDRFKTINDSLGHLTGDYLLKEVANRLCRAVRASDTVARLGGDEFVVLVPGVHASVECDAVGDKIIEALALPVPVDGHSLHISPSIGICLYPDDGADVETLMRHADSAMYHAKAAGRNNYQFFNQRINQAAARHFELESNLRTALANGEFEPFYQPIMDMATRRVHALEVLLRWRRPGIGLALPDDFIPILEENGMIVPVGEWVIRRACEQSMAWQRQGLPPVPLAINLSARQFMHRALVASIRRIVDETGIDPTLVEFEITESALMQHSEQTLEILGQINRMGMRLSIDDFGTGYSSLAYLKRFPVRKIKIDRAFIRELEASSEDRAIVAAVMALANSLQLQVVAEGVETEEQLALLQGYGCQYVQGWLFAKALDSEATRELLAADAGS